MELRDIEIFLTLAEELHFGRTAERLHVSQATKATEAARGMTGTVRVGVMGAVGHEIRDVTDTFRGRYPDCAVALREIHFSDPFTAVRTREWSSCRSTTRRPPSGPWRGADGPLPRVHRFVDVATELGPRRFGRTRRHHTP